MIFASAGLVLYESIQKIVTGVEVRNLGWVAAAAIIGFLGNELVALYRIRTGQQIGSAALVADGLHARTDGLTSLGVLAGAMGVWLGLTWADPAMGILIGLAILWVGWGAAREMWLRLMDAVDPSLSRLIESTAHQVEGVQEVHDITLRWLGHRQRSELHITVDRDMPTHTSHRIAEEVRHALFHALPALKDVTVHVDPSPEGDSGDHALAAHHD
jgi:cation diffusion facilitator family transporter